VQSLSPKYGNLMPDHILRFFTIIL